MVAKAKKLNLPSGKMLSKTELLNFNGGVVPPPPPPPGGGGGGDDGGTVTQQEYCAQLYAIISCNPGETTRYFNSNGCNNGTPGVTYWSSAQNQGIPINGSCNTSWYSY